MISAILIGIIGAIITIVVMHRGDSFEKRFRACVGLVFTFLGLGIFFMISLNISPSFTPINWYEYKTVSVDSVDGACYKTESHNVIHYVSGNGGKSYKEVKDYAASVKIVPHSSENKIKIEYPNHGSLWLWLIVIPDQEARVTVYTK